MRHSWRRFALAAALFLSAIVLALTSTSARADAPCYDQFQNQIPCPPAQKTPVLRRTKAPPPTATPTATETPTSSPTPTDTPTASPTGTSAPTATLTPVAATEPPANPSAPLPNGNFPQMPVIDGRLLPPWVFVVGGIWILVLVGLIVAWLFPGRTPNPNQPTTPPDGKQKTVRAPRRWYGGGALLWLLTGAILLQFHNILPGGVGEICGIDQFPDWVVVSIVPKTNDDIVFTVKNIGPCPAPKVAAIWNWGKSSVSNPYASCQTVEGKAPGVDPTPVAYEGGSGLGEMFGFLQFVKQVPPLASGESSTSTLNVPLGYWYLTHGEAKVGLQVNCDRKVKEENYYNDVGVYP